MPGAITKLRPYVNFIRLSKVTSPVPDSYPVPSGDLSVDIDFSMKMFVADGEPHTSGWAFDPFHTNKVKVLVFQVTTRDEHNFLTTMNFRNPEKLQNVLWHCYKANKYSYKIVSWEGIGDQNMSLLSNAKQVPGGVEYDIPFRLSDNGDEFIINSDRPHLSYFLLPFYDHGAASGNQYITSVPVFSDLEIKEVIYDNQITNSGLAFSLPTGEPWYGEIQLSSNNYFMTHDTNNNTMHLLNTSLTRNTVLQDFRVFQKFTEKINNITFDVNEGESANNRTYISDFLISRDGNKRNRFFFSVNILKAIKDGSSFAALFKNPVAASALQQFIKVKDIKIYRKALPFTVGEKELIVQSSDDAPGTLQEATYAFEDDLGEPKTFGAIKEVSSVNAGSGVRHFTGTDYDIANYSAGQFTYTTEIEILDPTVEYMKARKQELLEAQTTLEAYYSYFKSVSPRKRKVQYGTPQGKELLITSIDTFLSFLSFATGQPNSAAAALDVYDIIGPYTGTEKGIELFLASFSALLAKVESIIASAQSGSTNKATSNGTEQVTTSASPSPRTVTINNDKDKPDPSQIFSAVTNRTLGYELIDEAADKSEGVGLMTINFDSYLGRVEQEKDKYFTTSETSIGTHSQTGINLNLSTQMQYLTPLNIKMGAPHPAYAFNTSGGASYSMHNFILAEVMKYNLLGTNFDSGTPTQRLQAVSDLANALGIQVPVSLGQSTKILASEIESKSTEEDLVDVVEPKAGQTKLPWKDQPAQIKKQKQKTSAESQKLFDSQLDTIFSIITTTVMHETSKNTALDNYNLGNPTNNFVGIKQPHFDMLAMQTIALITYASFAMDPASAPLAYLYDMQSKDFAWFYQNFLNLYKIEILTNYSIDNDAAASGPSMKNPTYQPMSTNNFTSATARPNDKILCKLTKYQCVKENMLDEDILRFPVLNQYFLIDAYQLASVPASGQTSVAAGHQHAYQIDGNGNGTAAMAFHPQTDKIAHQHEIVNFAVQPAQSFCYPNCEDIYGHAGVGPHVHSIQGEDTTQPQVSDLNYNNLTYTEIDNQRINTGGAYRVFRRSANIQTDVTNTTQSTFMKQISENVWEDISEETKTGTGMVKGATGGTGGGY